jgi:flavin reductase (DIM6/NTAB) family NADH-FMN oxidoreductase RutF
MPDPAAEKPQASFRDAMRRLAATVTIVSARSGNRRHGITATAVMSLSMDPASLLVCINQSSSLYSLIREADRFCVNLLTSEQAALSDSFSGRLSGDERFLNGDWQETELGVPYLSSCQANIFCSKQDVIEYNTHAIIVGAVTDVDITQKVCPLIYSNGRYSRCAPLEFA